MNRVPASFPVRRSDGMIVKELADEVLVYDSTASKAFCLNKTSATIWNACDGRTSVAEIATRAEAALGLPVDEDVVRLALQQLSDDGLLTGPVAVTPSEPRLDRKRMMQRIGLGAAAVLPLILTIRPAIARVVISHH